MQIFTTHDEIRIEGNVSVALGNFDGIHVGHMKILEDALRYAKETQKTGLPHIHGFSRKYSDDAMILDAITLRNLEILNPLRGDRNDTTLFGFLNRTKTPMGSRVLRSTVTRPLTSPENINYRLDAVEYFTRRPVLLSTVRSLLSRFTDIERIGGRVAYGNASPRDLLALASSLMVIDRKSVV